MITDYELKDILDLNTINSLLQNYTDATGMISALFDIKGELLSKSNREYVNSNFSPLDSDFAKKNCKIDRDLLVKLKQEKDVAVYKCLNGMVDITIPVNIDGRHMGNLYTGQFFLERPDKELLIKQAEQHGINQDTYLQSISGVPIISLDDLKNNLRFLLQLTGIMADLGLTRIKEIETHRSLLESEANYSSLFEHMYEGFALIEIIANKKGTPVDFVFLDVNPAFGRITGIDAMEVLCKSFKSVVPDDKENAEKWIKKLGEVAFTGRQISFEEYVQYLNKWLSINAFSPKKGRLAVTFTDISERKKAEDELHRHQENLEELVKQRTSEMDQKTKTLEESQTALTFLVEDVNEISTQLRESNKKLRHANEELKAFSYSVSHDLRAPLRAIDGYSRIILEDYHSLLDDEGKSILSEITGNVEKMRRMIDAMLALSRLGRKKLHISQFNLRELIVKLIKDFNAENKDKVIKWEIGELSEISGDYGMLTQLFVNLISNAIKFSGKKNKPIISIGTTGINDQVTYYVKDNGVGFDMNYANKAFEAFHRLHTEEEFEGTGIGLATAKRIVLKHKGTIWAESKPNKGSTFFFTINTNQ